MSVLSVVVQDILMVALVVGILSASRSRFTWRHYCVFAAVAAGVAEVLFDIVTHTTLVGLLVWVFVAAAFVVAGSRRAKARQ